MKCCGIGHERQGNCGDRPEKCIMYTDAYLASEHQCEVNRCRKGKGKLCVHVVARYANCQGSHQANSARCPSRQKAEMQARKNKTVKNLKPPVEVTTSPGANVEEENIATSCWNRPKQSLESRRTDWKLVGTSWKVIESHGRSWNLVEYSVSVTNYHHV